MDVFAVVHTQARVTRILRRLAPHAPALVLLEGADAVCRRQVGLFWAAAVHCREIDPPCGACAACHAVTQDASRDLVWLRGEDGEIKVADARALRQMALDPPAAAPRRVVLITEAQAMNVEAQNALLKILEEPGPSTVFCVTVPHRDVLLPTVVSRAFALTLASVSPEPLEEAAAWTASVAEFAATGGGDLFARTGVSVEAALAQEVVLEVLRAVLATMRGVPQGQLADVFTRRMDVVTVREAQVLAEEALHRLRLGVNPALALEALAVGLWRLCA